MLLFIIIKGESNERVGDELVSWGIYEKKGIDILGFNFESCFGIDSNMLSRGGMGWGLLEKKRSIK